MAETCPYCSQEIPEQVFSSSDPTPGAERSVFDVACPSCGKYVDMTRDTGGYHCWTEHNGGEWCECDECNACADYDIDDLLDGGLTDE